MAVVLVIYAIISVGVSPISVHLRVSKIRNEGCAVFRHSAKLGVVIVVDEGRIHQSAVRCAAIVEWHVGSKELFCYHTPFSHLIPGQDGSHHALLGL